MFSSLSNGRAEPAPAHHDVPGLALFLHILVGDSRVEAVAREVCMADLRVAPKATGRLPDQELVARLAYELTRNREVLNYFLGALVDGWYPGREHSFGAKFTGSDRQRLEQIFKIRDVEVRRITSVLYEIGLDAIPIDYPAVYDELSKATEITAHSHKPIV